MDRTENARVSLKAGSASSVGAGALMYGSMANDDYGCGRPRATGRVGEVGFHVIHPTRGVGGLSLAAAERSPTRTKLG